MSSGELRQLCLDHFNEPMLIGWTLVRCIGYGEDESDCYIIVRAMGGERLWHSMVGGYVWLRCLQGQEQAGEWDDYKRLDNLLALNGAPCEPEFLEIYEVI